jgi:hypothetical protein
MPDWTITNLSTVSEKGGLGVALAAVFASGALGYIFATVHHFLHWYFPGYGNVLNHREFVWSLPPDVTGLSERSETTFAALDRRQADEIVMNLWCQQGKKPEPIGAETNKKLGSLTDLTHGLGAACVASFFALPTTLSLCATQGVFSWTCGPIFRFVVMLALAVLSIGLFLDAYLRVGWLAQGFCRRSLRAAISTTQSQQSNNATIEQH